MCFFGLAFHCDPASAVCGYLHGFELRLDASSKPSSKEESVPQQLMIHLQTEQKTYLGVLQVTAHS